MLEDILEVVLSVLFLPFESKIENMNRKLNRIQNGFFRVFLKVLLFLIPAALVFGIFASMSYLIRGYWI